MRRVACLLLHDREVREIGGTAFPTNTGMVYLDGPLVEPGMNLARVLGISLNCFCR